MKNPAMKIISKSGDPNVAEVYVAEFRGRKKLLAEFVDARDPTLPRESKWVIIISTQFGCPAGCFMCDAGGSYFGDLTADEMFLQIDHIISSQKNTDPKKVSKLKIQFARMGEPALNDAVIHALEKLPSHLNAPGLIPCIATIAPSSAKKWFEKLIGLRHTLYKGRDFQLQFSINSTDESARTKLMPLPKLSFAEISKLTEQFHKKGTRKAGLNFALAKDVPVNAKAVAKHFDPAFTCVKLTPLNPTYRAAETGLQTALPPDAPEKAQKLCDEFRSLGFDVIVSIGDTRENEIGSNCGMVVRKIISPRVSCTPSQTP